MFKDKGSYGCVAKPSIPCKRYYKESVSKIFYDKEEYNKEKEINDIIDKIDRKKRYTLKHLDDCKVKKVSKQLMKKCNIKELPKYQIIYEDGDIDLIQFMERDYNVKDIIPGLLNISEFLISLEKNGICHRDIKESNIMYHNKNFYLIDFGLSLPYEELYKKNQSYILKHNYCYYPPEFKIYYNYQFLKNLDKSSIDNLNKFITNDVILNYNKGPIVFEDSKIFDVVENIMKKISDMNMLNIIMKSNAHKIDVFSLGVVMMNLIIKSNDKYINKKIELLKIIDQCIDLNVLTRLTPKKLYNKLKDLRF